MKVKGGLLYLFLALVVVWLLVTASFQWDELVVGGLTVLVILLAVRKFSNLYGGFRPTPRGLFFLVVYGVIFLRELVKANLDVAFRVLNPSLPIRPGIVEVKTRMTSPIGKLLLANSITLTPGTLTLDVKGDRMFIHWIDVQGQDIDQTTGMIVGAFEKTLQEVVE
jgi:multicomponent Na+:H+ antiporter subunit E